MRDEEHVGSTASILTGLDRWWTAFESSESGVCTVRAMGAPYFDEREVCLATLAVSAGVAVGRVCLLDERRHFNLTSRRVSGDGVASECKRLEVAVTGVQQHIDALIHRISDSLGPAEAEIFRVQKMLLEDPHVIRQVTGLVQTKGFNAEAAVSVALTEYESRIRAMDDGYMRERATDIREVRDRVLDALRNTAPTLQCATEESCQRGRSRIIVAEELTPSLTVELDMKHTRGFITERGGPTSHAAILARALGIPAVSGIPDIHNRLQCGTEVLINGTTGEVVVWPSEKTLARYSSFQFEKAQRTDIPGPVAGLEVLANISLSSEVLEALQMKAEGIGLYRTEFEFIAANRLHNEDEQFERYASVVKAMKGKPVTIRLLDIGGDKPVSFLDLPKEPNPSLGLRGARLLLARPDLLTAQARALARASVFGPVDVLYPMIVGHDQFLVLKSMFIKSLGDLPSENLRHGVMFEVPSACLEARKILEVADFGSIGTNDLIQYLFAVDRDNEAVARDFDSANPVLWSLIGDLVRAARECDRPLAACGEAVATPALLEKFLQAGIRTVSVSARLIPEVRSALIRCSDRTAQRP